MDAERDWIGSVTLLLGAFGGAPLPHSGAAILYTYWPWLYMFSFFSLAWRWDYHGAIDSRVDLKYTRTRWPSHFSYYMESQLSQGSRDFFAR